MKTIRGGLLGVALLTISLVVGAGSATAGIGGSSIEVQSRDAGGFVLAAYGPIDAIDLSKKQLTILGQTVSLTSQTQATSRTLSLPRDLSSALLRSGNGALVAVYGRIQADGVIQATQIDFSSQAWVPGTTTVYVRGVVTQLRPAVARAQIGKLSVEYAAGLFDPSVADALRVGSAVEILGTKFSTGEMFASRVSVSGIGGSSTSGIGGSSTSGIGGSSTSGIGGSSTSGIGGSSTSGIGGSSTSGIGGSSTSGIGGSSTSGIGGSSLKGIGGSSASGIGGSSTSGIGGSSTSGIGGLSTSTAGLQ
jgi:hypothetical protein